MGLHRDCSPSGGFVRVLQEVIKNFKKIKYVLL